MQVSLATHKIKVDPQQCLRLQIMLEIGFVRRQTITHVDAEILVAAASATDGLHLRDLCAKSCEVLYPEKATASQTQHIRNRVAALQKRGYLVKQKRTASVFILIAPELKFDIRQPLLMHYQFLCLATDKV